MLTGGPMAGSSITSTRLADLASPITLLQNWNPETKKYRPPSREPWRLIHCLMVAIQMSPSVAVSV